MFDILFFAVIGSIVVGVVMMVIGSFIQFAIIGSIFGLVMKRMKQQIVSENPKSCSFCGSTIPSGENKCPNCGSSRESVDA